MKLQSMSLLHGFQAKHKRVTNNLIIRLPDFNGLRLVPKAIILALIIAAFPSFGLAIRELPEVKAAFGTTNQRAFPLYFNDLSKEGHLQQQSLLPDVSFDFVFTHDVIVVVTS